MKTFFLTATIAALGLTGCNAAADEQVRLDRENRAQVEIAEALNGYVRGETRNCLPVGRTATVQTFGDGTIIFDRGSQLHVQRLSAGCERVDEVGVTMVTETSGTPNCSGDIVRLVDLTTGSFYGSCTLGDWTEYNRVN